MNGFHERCPIIMKNTYLLKSSKKEMVLLSLFTTEIFNVLQLKCIKLIMGFPSFLAVIYLSRKIVILTIFDRVLSFPDLFLKLYFMEKKAYFIQVQEHGTYFLLYTKNYVAQRLSKTWLKNGKLTTVLADFSRHMLVELGLHQKILKFSNKLNLNQHCFKRFLERN